MISIDTNILLYSYSAACSEHAVAHAFLQDLAPREDVAISEFILTEFYLLLRNPAVLETPLTAAAAADVIASYRSHPRWKTFGFPPRSRVLHNQLWQHAASAGFPRRRIYDCSHRPQPHCFWCHRLRHREPEGLSRLWVRASLESPRRIGSGPRTGPRVVKFRGNQAA